MPLAALANAVLPLATTLAEVDPGVAVPDSADGSGGLLWLGVVVGGSLLLLVILVARIAARKRKEPPPSS